jgi:flagellar biogenesis protein FliO
VVVEADEEPQSPNYALRLTEALDDVPSPDAASSRRGFRAPYAEQVDARAAADNFSLKLSEALEAISKAQGVTPPPMEIDKTLQATAEAAPQVRSGRNLSTLLASLDKLPPIRLPFGPAIPWRFGLPMLVALVAAMFFIGRPVGRADAQGVRLPAQQTYAIQQEAPLFTSAQPTPTQPAIPSAASPQPLGVQDPGGFGFDLLDVGIKLFAVLALAYGSMMLLKRAGVGGSAGTIKTGGTIQGMRVVSTLVLAPNRSVHVLKVPGGKSLLVGATPNQVNLIAELGVLSEDELPDAASFFDVLKGKLSS